MGGGGGRAVALTHIPHLLPADPDSDNPAAAYILLELTGCVGLVQAVQGVGCVGSIC